MNVFPTFFFDNNGIVNYDFLPLDRTVNEYTLGVCAIAVRQRGENHSNFG